MVTIKEQANRLVQLILKHIEEDGSWHIPVDVALSALDVDMVDYYRRLYERRVMVDTIAPKHFGPENVTALIAGMCKDLDGCESIYQDLGIFLSVDHQSELTEAIIENVSDTIRKHRIDHDLFAGMNRRYPHIRTAISVYIDYCFDIEELTGNAIERFLGLHPDMNEIIARFQAKRLVALLFQRNILSADKLFESISYRLAPESRKTDDSPKPQLNKDLAESLSILGLTTLPGSVEDLKRIYRSLMKTYHPDVNPRGLAMSQKITHAYSQLRISGIWSRAV